MTRSLADSFRIIDIERILFGIEAVNEPHLLALFAARMSRLSALHAHRLHEALADGTRLGPDIRSGGALVTSAALPEFGGVVWAAARLITPVPVPVPAGPPVDLAFAVIGNPRSVTARSAVQTFRKLAADREALDHLRAANSISWFRAELTYAFERLDHREPDKMTG